MTEARVVIAVRRGQDRAGRCLPAQLGLRTGKALATGVDHDGGSARVGLIHDQIGKIELERRDLPVERPGESPDSQPALVGLGILRVQDGGTHVRAEIDGGRLERVAILSEQDPALRAVRGTPDAQRPTQVATHAQVALRVGEIAVIGRSDRVRMRRPLALVSVVEPQAPENSESVARFPVELRVQAAKLATVIESVDLIDMPGGARRRCPAIEQRRVSKIPALLRPNARQPIEPRGQTERARQWHGDKRVEIQLPHPAVLVEAIGLVAVGPARELRPQEAAYLVGPRAGAGEQDRKSTRLNSSHGYISYAVFCLKKKKKHMTLTR